jgi:hypothetical protein
MLRDLLSTEGWRAMLVQYVRAYVLCSLFACVLLSLLIYHGMSQLGRTIDSVTVREMFLGALVPFFAPYGCLALGFSLIFQKLIAEDASGRVFWRFNLLNGTAFWIAFWLVVVALSFADDTPQGGSMLKFAASVIVSLPMFIFMSGLASLMSFVFRFVPRWGR